MMNNDDASGMGQLRRSRWRKSSYSGTAGNCVEVAELGPGVRAVRDSKDPGGLVLTCTARQWSAFTAHLRAGELA
jgi:Domain of unknown function (DUF397)